MHDSDDCGRGVEAPISDLVFSVRRPVIGDRQRRKYVSMSYATSMLRADPRTFDHDDRTVLAGCIEACLECSQVCTACAEACLSERDVARLSDCIRIVLDCADVTGATARVLSRHPGYDANLRRALLAACRAACALAADQCERGAEAYTHCRVCADACRRCEAACARLVEIL